MLGWNCVVHVDVFVYEKERLNVVVHPMGCNANGPSWQDNKWEAYRWRHKNGVLWVDAAGVAGHVHCECGRFGVVRDFMKHVK